MFSRRHALEIERRLVRTAQIGMPDELFRDPRIDDGSRGTYSLARRGISSPSNLHAIASLQSSGEKLTRLSLTYLCADPELNWVMSVTEFPEFAESRAQIPLRKLDGTMVIDHFLYNCEKVRR